MCSSDLYLHLAFTDGLYDPLSNNVSEFAVDIEGICDAHRLVGRRSTVLGYDILVVVFRKEKDERRHPIRNCVWSLD